MLLLVVAVADAVDVAIAVQIVSSYHYFLVNYCSDCSFWSCCSCWC